ncbi:MAG TPA: hypothetical protein VFB19_04575 [Mycobacterium sp.]|nr:hypothetical protein [Mycobacterium sp.]
MTTTDLRHTAPADDTRRAHADALVAFRAAVERSAELWRRTPAPNAPVPGLTWSAAQTAAHMVGDLTEYTEGLEGHSVAAVGSGSPSKRSAAANARHLEMVGERDMRRLADTLEEQAVRYIDAASNVDEGTSIHTANGLVLTPPIMTCLLLGEQLVHGLDIARAGRARWCISRADALLVIPGVLTVAPQYVHPTRSANESVSFELRIRGGGRYRLAVHHGTAEITAAGEKADCVISADPVAFLLVGYGRIAQWRPIIGLNMMAFGRKPWLATKFGSLISSP